MSVCGSHGDDNGVDYNERMKMMGSGNEEWIMKDESSQCASDDNDHYDNDDG